MSFCCIVCTQIIKVDCCKVIVKVTLIRFLILSLTSRHYTICASAAPSSVAASGSAADDSAPLMACCTALVPRLKTPGGEKSNNADDPVPLVVCCTAPADLSTPPLFVIHYTMCSFDRSIPLYPKFPRSSYENRAISLEHHQSLLADFVPIYI